MQAYCITHHNNCRISYAMILSLKKNIFYISMHCSFSVVLSRIMATGVSCLPYLLNISMILYSLLIAIRMITVADDCAINAISFAQQLSLIPRQVSGIIYEAGTARALEIPGIISTFIPACLSASISSSVQPNTNGSPLLILPHAVTQCILNH